MLKCFIDTVMGHAMAEVVTCQPLTTEAWVYSRLFRVGLVDEVVLGQVPLLSTVFFPYQYPVGAPCSFIHSSPKLHKLIS